MSTDQKSVIAAALSWLGTQTDDNPFVIIQHAETRKFVQFAGSARETLLLDLPYQTLSEPEFYRAVKMFRELGISGEEHDTYDRPDGNVVGQQFTFNMAFDSVDEAALTAQRVFREIYEYPADCPLEIIKS
ncbi:MAG: hypothetical protein R3C18_22810 [Planctomycetaceae bacterium]